MDVTSIATSGLRAADLQLATAAQNIANADTPDYQQQNVTQTADASGGGVQSNVTSGNGDVDVAQQLVNTDIATYDFKANLTVLKKQQETQQSLLDIMA